MSIQSIVSKNTFSLSSRVSVQVCHQPNYLKTYLVSHNTSFFHWTRGGGCDMEGEAYNNGESVGPCGSNEV